jgi:hypothetical protein
VPELALDLLEWDQGDVGGDLVVRLLDGGLLLPSLAESRSADPCVLARSAVSVGSVTFWGRRGSVL